MSQAWEEAKISFVISVVKDQRQHLKKTIPTRISSGLLKKKMSPKPYLKPIQLLKSKILMDHIIRYREQVSHGNLYIERIK